ncbi:MAG: hypothetical protein M1828_007350 [Chrysothrix sp. TS-e1954]|nr:MAG: hypothetical protein M1828_007350 [Chrysothrix sp. TS-e1954]
MTKIYAVQHLDSELGDWSALEYATIARECNDAGARFMLCSVSPRLQLPSNLESAPGLQVERRGVETLFADRKERVCLLDPAAEQELSPEDEDLYDVFVFGGILGDDPPRGRQPSFIKGFQGRRLGPIQMTTDTAARAARMVIQERRPLDSLPYIDYPEIRVDEHESVQMPFRYIKDEAGKMIMPPGMVDLIKKDSEKGFGELL